MTQKTGEVIIYDLNSAHFGVSKGTKQLKLVDVPKNQHAVVLFHQTGCPYSKEFLPKFEEAITLLMQESQKHKLPLPSFFMVDLDSDRDDSKKIVRMAKRSARELSFVPMLTYFYRNTYKSTFDENDTTVNGIHDFIADNVNAHSPKESDAPAEAAAVPQRPFMPLNGSRMSTRARTVYQSV
jgi:hypothetical protein